MTKFLITKVTIHREGERSLSINEPKEVEDIETEREILRSNYPNATAIFMSYEEI